MCTVTICFLIFHAQLITQFFSNFQQLINQCDVNMVNAMYNGMGGIIQNKLAANKNVPQTQTENRNPIDVGNDLSETSNECIDNDFFDDNDSSDSDYYYKLTMTSHYKHNMTKQLLLLIIKIINSLSQSMLMTN